MMKFISSALAVRDRLLSQQTFDHIDLVMNYEIPKKIPLRFRINVRLHIKILLCENKTVITMKICLNC